MTFLCALIASTELELKNKNTRLKYTKNFSLVKEKYQNSESWSKKYFLVRNLLSEFSNPKFSTHVDERSSICFDSKILQNLDSIKLHNGCSADSIDAIQRQVETQRS